ncbi:MAG: YfcE family phosphodiesterase [Planctomycetales bacterium]
MSRLVVVSDTHGNLTSTRQATEMIERLQPDCVIHCGDIGDTAVIPFFDRWPTHFVFGNCDPDEVALTRAIEAAGQHCHRRFGSLELEGVKIAFLHSDDHKLFQNTIFSGEYSLVCYGHTHQVLTETVEETIVLNPGALHRARPYTFAVVELPQLSIEIQTLA